MERKLRPLVVGNWKMNGSRAAGQALIAEVIERRAAAPLVADLLVCPPFPYLDAISQGLSGSGIALGAQDCHPAEQGAHTGDVAAAMLKDMGCSTVILGHSERRQDYGEDSTLVAAKARAAMKAGLTALICIGETEAERLAGRTLEIVQNQLLESLPGESMASNCEIAYEPVWAIGSGRVPTMAEIAEVHAHIRALLRRRIAGGEGVRILYGGSVKPGNAAAILALPEVNGALVGGASLVAADFCAIAAMAR